MATFLTATQAASKLGKSEKTIRRWIKEGRLHAHHPNGRPNLLAISEDDIEQLATELAQYEQKDTGEDTSSLEQRVKQLEQEISRSILFSGPDMVPVEHDLSPLAYRLDALESRIAEIERILSVGTPAQPAERATRTRTPHATIARIEPLENLPQGSTPYYRFAEMHGVVARTFRDHIQKHGVEAITRQRPGRDEKTYWLSPEQQRAAIVYWKANNTPYHECDLCPHDDSVYQRASQDQQSAEDQGKTDLVKPS